MKKKEEEKNVQQNQMKTDMLYIFRIRTKSQ